MREGESLGRSLQGRVCHMETGRQGLQGRVWDMYGDRGEWIETTLEGRAGVE